MPDTTLAHPNQNSTGIPHVIIVLHFLGCLNATLPGHMGDVPC